MDAGILPVKSLGRGKERLASHLDGAERRRLTEALFADALDLCDSVDFLEWWVVSDGPEVLEQAQARGFNTVADPGDGLNPALTAAIAAALATGAESVTIIPSDAPLAFRGDLVDLLDTGATSDLVVVPSEKDGGTNGLYMSPPELFRPTFGEGSLRRHLDMAAKAGYRCSLLSLPRLALDIDTIEDIRDYLAKPKHAPSRTATVLEDLRDKVGV